jgi:hypothetical protein
LRLQAESGNHCERDQRRNDAEITIEHERAPVNGARISFSDSDLDLWGPMMVPLRMLQGMVKKLR